MPTPQEKALQTKERKRKEEEEQEREAARLREEEFERRHTELQEYQSEKAAYELLVSEVEGLYDEMDKLARKVPNEPMTPLQMKVINSFIKKSKRLMSSDSIVDEVEIFVATGDYPEYRDAVTVLRQLKQGLGRYKAKNSYLFSRDFTDELVEHELDEEVPDDFFSVEEDVKGETESDVEAESEDGTAE